MAVAEKKEGKLDGNVESDAKKEMSAAQRDPKRARREDESLKTVAAQPDRANNANKEYLLKNTLFVLGVHFNLMT